jgi:hypothetical protein
MLSLDKIQKLAAKFQKLADEDPLTVKNPSVISEAEQEFYTNLSKFIGKTLSSQDYLDWLEINKNVMINKTSLHNLIKDNDWWFVNDSPSFMEAFFLRDKAVRFYLKPYSNGDISESTLLTPAGVIPKIWSYLGNFQENTLTTGTDKELAHNFYIWEAFNKGVFDLNGDSSQDIRNTVQFVNQNKPKIDGLRHFFTKNPQFLGRGSDGAVFDVGEFILKIFRDPVAYQAAEAAMHRLHKEPELAKTEAMIYDAGKLGVFRNKDVFYYVMEKMIPISNIDLDFKNKVKDLIRKISIAIMNSSIKDLKGKSNIRVELDSIVEFIASYFNNSNLVKDITEMNRKHDKNDNSMIVPFLRSEWLRLLVEEICLKYLTGRIDLHVDNIGITNNGELRYFDSAYGGWEAIPDGLHMGYGEVISGK